MSLRQKVGQVFMLGFDGTRVTERTRALVAGLHLGGITLFARNIEDARQLRQLTQELQRLADSVPLFISIDQEGGLVVRITEGATIFPGNMALGATRDPRLARQVAAAAASELLAMGVNMNLAPVVDVNTNPLNPVIGVRAFGADPELVAALGVQTIGATQAAGVSAVAKHFPGHGDTSVDSHRDLPVVGHAIERLRSVELAPFEAAIAAGVDGVMTAHVYLPAVEPSPELPATLSRRVLKDLLRGELGYRGLILTDALEMAAITRDRSAAEAAVNAFEAGADLLLIAGSRSDDRSRAADGPRALLAAVESGRIPQERLEASVLRILEIKTRRGVLSGAATSELFDSAAHRELALEVARRAVTLQRDRAGLLPLSVGARVLVIEATAASQSGAVDDQLDSSLLQSVRRFAPCASGRAIEADVIVLGTFDLARDAEQQALARELAASGKPVVGVSLRGPYDAAAAPEIGTYLAVYGDRPVHLQAAAEALFGRLLPTGQVP